jgi:hypothetical protein
MKDIQKIKEFFSKPLNEGNEEYFKPVFRKDKSYPDFLYVDIAYPAGSDVLSVGGSKTMGGQDREEGAAKALSMGNNVAKKLEAKYNIDSDDIEVKDLKNGKVQVFAISDKFIKMASPSLDEAEEEETAIDMAKKQLDALGVEYEMSGNKFRPFEAIYRPKNESNEFYGKFNRIVYEFNLESAVKQKMNESLTAGYPHRKTSGEGFEKIVIVEPMDDATKNKMIRNFRAEGWDAKPNNGGGITAIKKTTMEEAKFMSGLLSGKDFINAKLKNYPKAVAKVNQLIDMIGEDKFTIEMAEWVFDFFNNASYESPVNEATKDEETKFHKKLDKLVHNTFGKRKGEMEEAELTEAYVPSNIKEFAKRKGVSSLVNKVAGWAEKVGARIAGGTAIGKNYGTLILDLDYKQQGEIRINIDEETVKLYNKPVYSFNDFQRVYAAEEIEEGFYGRGDKRRGLQNQSKLSSAEYQMAKKLKSFKASDWKWNADEDLYNKVTEATDYMKRRQAQDDYAVNKKDKPKKPNNPNPSGKTDYMKRREKELAETILAKLKK